jgi:hypothetical protein
MLGIVPPSFWCQAAERSPAELFAAIEGSEWKLVLGWGWAQAARRHRDQDWLKVCLEASLGPLRSGKYLTVGDLSDFQRTIAGLSADCLDPLLTRLLYRHQDIAHGMILALVQSPPRPWGKELSRPILDWIQNTIQSTNRANDHYLSAILPAAGSRIPVSYLDELSQLYSNIDPAWPPYVVKAIGDFLDLLRFRHEMLSELQP